MKPAPQRKLRLAMIFACIGVVALALSGYYGRQRYLRENPPPLPHVIPPLTPAQITSMQMGLRLVSKTVLMVSPEQDEKLQAIWDKPPRSVDEVIDYQKRTNDVLTTSQRALFRPMRKRFQDRVIDEMLGPVGERIPPAEFEKMKAEVKRRVDERIDGP